MATHPTISERTVQRTLSRVALCGGSAGGSSSLLKRAGIWLVMAVVAWFLAATLFSNNSYAAERVASVEYSKGAVSAIDPNGSPRLIGRGSELFTGDLIETASQSFAIVKFEDGTLMTLRPDTAFRVEDFQPEDGKGQALFKLLKGGFRVLTGFISKSSDGVFRVDTPVATIGVRGTEFDARLCADPRCLDGASASADAQNAAAVVAQMRGSVSITNGNREVAASPGSPVQAGATVKTSDTSWALLIFIDGSRVTVEPNTEFEISEFNYDKDQANNSSFIVRLLVGSMRALTGAIARLNPAGYRVETASANLGVRGTGFDLAVTDGIALHVWDSCVDISSATGSLPVCAGQYATQTEPDSVPELVDQLPSSLRSMSGPRPDSDDIADADQLLGSIEPRLYVSVTEGLVDLTNEGERVQIGADQNALVTPEGEISLIEVLPDSMVNDVMPKPGEINDRLLGLFDLVQGGLSRDAGQTARAAAAASSEESSSDSGSDSSGSTDGGEEVAEVESDRFSSEEKSPVKEPIPLECAVQ